MGYTGISIVPRHVLGNGFKAPSDIFNLGIIAYSNKSKVKVLGVDKKNLLNQALIVGKQ